MAVKFDGFQVPYVHQWPLEREEYEGAIKFRADVRGRSIPVLIAFGEREAFGRKRRRVLVIVNGKVMLELVGTDDYDSTGELIGVLKQPKSEKHFRRGEPIPLELSGFTLVLHKHYIKGGYNTLGVLFKEIDIKGMIEYGLTRARLEELI